MQDLMSLVLSVAGVMPQRCQHGPQRPRAIKCVDAVPRIDPDALNGSEGTLTLCRRPRRPMRRLCRSSGYCFGALVAPNRHLPIGDFGSPHDGTACRSAQTTICLTVGASLSPEWAILHRIGVDPGAK